MTLEDLAELLQKESTINEGRRNPELNPKVSAIEALKPYSTNEDYYISFTAIDKIGINPRSSYNTPLGIYAYPLATIWRNYMVEHKKSIGKAVPFAGRQPYIWLIKPKENSNLVDMEKYTEQDFKNDKEKLLKHIQNNKEEYTLTDMSVNNINDMFDSWSNTATRNTPICKIWNITRKLSMGRNGKKTTQWNVLLRKVLGYSGFVDKTNKGYIHESEPTQAVFLSRSAFTVVKQILNKDYTGTRADSEAKIPEWVKKAKTIGMKNIKNFHNIFVWEKGTWVSGIWEDGIWHNGIWKDGTWNKGTWLDGTWELGTWLTGTWKNGDWNKGTWKDGTWKDGIWKNGTWEDGTWENGEWKNGMWHSGDWKNGIWYDGEWYGGRWFGGVWKGGTWRQGYIHDPKREGNFASNAKWLGNYVLSKINPAEYWKGKVKFNQN